ncbi:M23 family metallopeptidase [Bacteriovoracaceae bacterium]|nr:M23 family metallopeptidase [Bacteriovoracaceae bacterium]
MKQSYQINFYFIKYLVFFILFSCADGNKEVIHQGECEGYDNWEESDYKLPWPVGDSYKVLQGNCSSFSHIGTNRFAYDFDMSIGSTITAVRAGEVIEVEESFEDGNGCPNANIIKIEHDDDTVAEYHHLTKDGALVEKGDTVAQGDEIAESGNTGCSTTPHLHFQVWIDSNYEDTIPVNFSNTDSNPRGLVEGEDYEAE